VTTRSAEDIAGSQMILGQKWAVVNRLVSCGKLRRNERHFLGGFWAGQKNAARL